MGSTLHEVIANGVLPIVLGIEMTWWVVLVAFRL
jgi:hypothetical protein